MLKKIFGALFLLGAIACVGFAYLIGSADGGNYFDFDRMMRDGSTFLLAIPVCLFLGIGLMFQKKPLFQRKKSATP
jgi:hypothetical protein